MGIEYPEHEILAQGRVSNQFVWRHWHPDRRQAGRVLVAGANIIALFLALGVLAIGRRQAAINLAGA